MSNLSYSFTDLSLDHQENRLRYISAASYGNDWKGILHAHDCTEIFYVTGGEGSFCTEEQTIPLHQDQLVVVNPRFRHTERSSAAQNMRYIVLGIDNLQFRFGKDAVLRPFEIFTVASHRSTVLPLLSVILEELRSKKPCYEEICQHYLSILLLMIRRITGREFTVSQPSSIPYECEKVRSYLDAHFREPLTLESLAALAHWDKFYFSHQFSRAYGISPINYLLEKRIEHSRYLLKTTDYSVTQIAEAAGFSSQNYFSQIFRKSTGMSPRQYRKNMAEKAKGKKESYENESGQSSED